MIEVRKVESNESEDFIYDPVRGGMGKRPLLSVLNKKKVTRQEMDEVFLDFY